MIALSKSQIAGKGKGGGPCIKRKIRLAIVKHCIIHCNVSTVLPPSQLSKHQLPCQLYLGSMIADMSTQPDDTTPQPGLRLRLADVGLGGRAQPLGLPLFAVRGVGERTAEHVPLDSPHEPLHSGQAGGRHCRPFIRLLD